VEKEKKKILGLGDHTGEGRGGGKGGVLVKNKRKPKMEGDPWETCLSRVGKKGWVRVGDRDVMTEMTTRKASHEGAIFL